MLFLENRKLIDRDEIYFLVFFSNFFIGMLLLTIKYNFDSIQAFFVFANIDPIPYFSPFSYNFIVLKMKGKVIDNIATNLKA